MSELDAEDRVALAATRATVQAGHIFLVGFMGSGKSTVGRLMAEEFGIPFVDLDELIQMREGLGVAELFSERGEPGFRSAETEALSALESSEPTLVACGGGIVLAARNRELLASLGCVVFLEVTAGEALKRIGDVEGRPLLAVGGFETAATLLNSREPLYRSAADVVIDTSGKAPEEVAREAVRALRLAGCAS